MVESQVPTKKVKVSEKIKTIVIVILVIALFALYYSSKVEGTNRDWFWGFVIVVTGLVVIMYLMLRKKKVWNPIEIIRVIDKTMSEGGYHLNTVEGGVEVHYASNSPQVRFFYFSKNQVTPMLVAWNMLEERIDAFYIRSPDELNKFFENSKRVDVDWGRDRIILEKQLKDQQEGIVSEPAGGG